MLSAVLNHGLRQTSGQVKSSPLTTSPTGKTEAVLGEDFLFWCTRILSPPLPEFDADCEMIWIKINLQKNVDLLVGCFRMPHRNSKDLAELEKSLQKAMGGQRQKQIPRAGDFNSPDVEWNGATVNPNAPDWQIQQASTGGPDSICTAYANTG